MIKMVILLCTLGVEPAECTKHSAVASIQTKVEYKSQIQCRVERAIFLNDPEFQRQARRQNRVAGLTCVQDAIA